MQKISQVVVKSPKPKCNFSFVFHIKRKNTKTAFFYTLIKATSCCDKQVIDWISTIDLLSTNRGIGCGIQTLEQLVVVCAVSFVFMLFITICGPYIYTLMVFLVTHFIGKIILFSVGSILFLYYFLEDINKTFANMDGHISSVFTPMLNYYSNQFLCDYLVFLPPPLNSLITDYTDL